MVNIGIHLFIYSDVRRHHIFNGDRYCHEDRICFQDAWQQPGKLQNIKVAGILPQNGLCLLPMSPLWLKNAEIY